MPTGLLGERGTVNPAGFCTLTLTGHLMCANSANSGASWQDVAGHVGIGFGQPSIRGEFS